MCVGGKATEKARYRVDFNIGDSSLIYQTTSNYPLKNLNIEFSVRNLAVKIWLINSLDVEVANSFAQIIFDKLK